MTATNKAKLTETKQSDPLYEQDYYLWLQKTASLIASGKLQELDVVNLLEEIEDMGRSEKRAIYSNLKILLFHLLKYKYQPDKRNNSWQYTIAKHRQRIAKAIEESPSLKFYLPEIYLECYQKARKLATKETGLALTIFPQECPFVTGQILNEDWLPEE